MTPFFSPAPHDYSRIPVYLAAVNEKMLHLVGEICDGAFIHAIHTVPYLEQFALPHIQQGLEKSGRKREDVTLATSIFVIPTDDPQYAAKAEAHVRQQLSFYLSTPAYQVVMEMHGWQEIGAQLSKLARQGEWETMAKTLTDEMMETMVLTGTWDELPQRIQTKYGGLLDRVSYYLPFVSGEVDDGWRTTIAGFKHHA
jgi:probable F420-dependent oxidoreductase